MNDNDFLSALETVADELLRRADACAGEDTTEPCNLILSNAATGCLIALNVLSSTRGRAMMIDCAEASVEAAAASGVASGVSSGAILS